MKTKNQWRPRIINIMSDGSQVENLTGYTIPKDSGYYNAIRRINKEDFLCSRLRRGGLGF